MDMPRDKAKKLFDDSVSTLIPLIRRKHNFEDQLKAINDIEQYFPRCSAVDEECPVK